MKDIHLKIKLIYFPFLMTSAGFIIVYTFLHWLLILKLKLLKMDEMFINFWIPMAFILVLLFTVVRKKIELLNLTSWRGRDPEKLYYLVATMAIMVPTFIAQPYIRTTTGKLTRVASVEQMDLEHGPIYYQFDKIYLDKRFTGLFWYTNTSGKHNSTLNFHAFFALPVMSSPQDTSKRYFTTWYGFEYADQMSNRSLDSEKETTFRKFQESCIEKYNKVNLYQYVYFDRIGYNDLHNGLQKAVEVTNNYNHTVEPVILTPVNEPFEQRNGSKLEWMIGSYVVLSLIWLLFVLYTPLCLNKIKNKI